ncbi:DMT family transporter [Herbiconiux daphne]|uniref:DMT family transporter n=1 Tax=Herbiconiux daphne TaxID=2970914 RepID=A0ABT2H839_9MICO|nr:DMT family transporter [Herbiconiux daphne]MCS5736101.1 DMT family transporter [Herbiconiux daphne]
MTLATFPLAGIVLAVIAAAVLAVGNFFQARGVSSGATGPSSGLGAREILRLLRNRAWLIGSAFLVVAILLQLASLAFAPLIVVQPVGVTALVFAALLTAFVTKAAPARREVGAIAVCIVSVGVFVTVAAVVSTQSAIGETQLVAVLIVLAVVLVASLAVLLLRRGRSVPPILFVLLGGIFSGFVATLGKTVILRVQTALASHDLELDSANLLTIGCLAGIAVAGLLSIYFVQTSHTSSRPEVVVAGLTVIDPFVAVILGITILGEARNAPIWAILVLVVAGAVAVLGVVALSRTQAAAAVGSP